MPRSSPIAAWLSACVVAACTITGFVLFSNMRSHALLPAATSTAPASPSDPPIVYVNTTQLAHVCIQACGVGGVCSQDTLTGITTCTACGGGPGYTVDPASGACANTAECTQYAWCTSAESTITVVPTHVRFARVSWFGPYALNFTLPPFPVSRYNELAPFVPLLADTAVEAAALLDVYVSGQLALGGGGANTVEYFDDQTGFWNTSLSLYKATVPSLYASYIGTLKRKLCARTWQALQGSCVVPNV